MVIETILQHEVLTKFAYPFLLIFFIVFAVLEKTKVLGDDKKQINALVAFVIGLIFVSAVSPKMVVGDLILFLTIALVVMFVGLLLWGFVAGGEPKLGDGIKKVLGVGIVLAIVVALFAIFGISGSFFDFLFKQSWSEDLWINISFVVVIAVALALVLKKK